MSKYFNIETIHENLELLRSLTNLNKAEFSKMLGVANAYRKDIDSIGYQMWSGIKEYFNVTEKEWLLKKHEKKDIEFIKYTPRKEITPDYSAHEHRHPYNEGLTLIGKADIVLKSNTIYGEALAKNIEAFYRAVLEEKKIGKDPPEAPAGVPTDAAGNVG